MELQQLSQDFAVCKLQSTEAVDLSKAFTFVAVTNDEISLVCDASNIPVNAIAVETGWKGLKISGTLGFDLVGVIAKIASLLAEQHVAIFVVSTYNTDYILLKEEYYDKAVKTLRSNSYCVL